MIQPVRTDPVARPSRLTSTWSHVVGATIAIVLAYAFDTVTRLALFGPILTLTAARRYAAFAHGLALVAPTGLVVAALLVVVEAIAPDVAQTARRLLSLRRLLRRDPDALAQGVAMALGVATAIAPTVVIALRAQADFHSQPVILAVVVATAIVASSLGAGVRRRAIAPLAAFLRGLDGAASPLLFWIVASLFVVVAIRRQFEINAALMSTIPWQSIQTMSVFAVVELVVASTLATAPRTPPSLPWLATAMIALVLIGTSVSIATYGRTTSQRQFVEEVSWSGSLAHRAFSVLLDRDRDGFPSLLGGRDCDDAAPQVHPGALDRPGDGVDSDCFGGDGTPPFDDRRRPQRVLSPATRPPNILLVSIDAMRPDRLVSHGSPRVVAPRLDALAAESVVYRHASSSSPRTTRSIPAIFTGQHPGAIQYDRTYNRLDLGASAITLAELLAPTYETAAILGTTYFREAPNILQGFERIEHGPSIKPPPSFATDRALEFLGGRAASAAPFFLWVHYFGPHEPYLLDGTRSRFGRAPTDLYDTEIARTDTEVGRLLDGLAERGLGDDTVIVVFSDHGESFGERAAWGHSTRLTDDQIRSLLMIRAPSIAPRRVDVPVGLFDLFPTVLDFARTDTSERVSARNLVPSMRGDDSALIDRDLFAQILPDAIYAIETQSIRRGAEKLIFFPRTGRLTLYDVASDPLERRDVADNRRASVSALLHRLLAWDASLRSDNRSADIIARAEVRAIPSTATPLDARFGDGLTLVGAEIRPSEVGADEIVTVDLYLRAERVITEEAFVRLTFTPATGPASVPVMVAHHSPLDGTLAPRFFRPGQIYRDTVTLRVPPSARPDEDYLGSVAIWWNFHHSTPVSVRFGGVEATEVPVGSFRIE